MVLMIQCTQKQVQPPAAKIMEHKDTTFSDVRTDNYFWLRDRENKKVIDYLEAENNYTETMTRHTEGLQKSLYDEMVSRIKETDATVPYKSGTYYYYSRTEQGKQYSIHCRKKGTTDAKEEILLDENELAKGHKYFDLGIFQVSPNHNLLAYSVDTSGSESFTIYVMDLKSGKILSDEISGTYYSLAWANDNKTFFYNIIDAATRPYKLFRHQLGAAQAEDELVYHEKDEKFFLNIQRSKSGSYLFLRLGSQITTEVHFLNADTPKDQFKLIAPRQNNVEYFVNHHTDYFYIRTNENALNYKLMKTRIKYLAKKYWEEVIPVRDNVTIDAVELFINQLVVFNREDGLVQVQVTNHSTGQTHPIKFEESVYNVFPSDNKEFEMQTLRFNYSSLITPNSVYDYDMVTKKRELKKRKEVGGGYAPENYHNKRIYAQASDGTEIPISIVYKKDMKKDGNNRVYLYGYGSYGYNIEPKFSSNRFSMIDRGFIYAIAHVRGSSTMGRQWYEDGKLLKKKNTFTDFIACAEYLIKEKYTNSQKLAMVGGSAGGLLMGAVVNMQPDLFKAVVAQVPFVDVINTMLDASIPLTVIEYEEWGNPNVEEFYHYMKSYSPYDNVQSKNYPHILITAGLNDPRVQYWEPAKWTAKLRALKTDDNLLLLKTNMGAGHGGASGRYDYLKEVAFDYAFVLDRLGVNQ